MTSKLAVMQHIISVLECLGTTEKGGLIQFGGSQVMFLLSVMLEVIMKDD